MTGDNGASGGELSGADWVARFPTHTDLEALDATFQANVRRFLAALKSAGAAVTITATKRPVERAYLMHWAYLIAKQAFDPTKAPALAGVDIVWAHPTLAASRQAAQDMVNGYGISRLGVPPALNSRHTEGKALDMVIGWSGTLTIAQADGTKVAIAGTPRDHTNPDLIKVGKTYQVIHFKTVASDPVHWSVDGH